MNENANIQETTKTERPIIKATFDWVDSIVASVIVVVVLFAFVFRVVGIVGDSMTNTLLNNDRVIIYNLFYTPKQGDIIVVSRNIINNVADEAVGKEPIIKRVIATEGQKVDIVYGEDGIGHVFVDGVQFSETMLKEPMRDILIDNPVSFPQTVPEGHVFVLGDNRNGSLDSRSADIGDFGMIDTRYVMGKAFLRIYPLSEIGVLK